MSTSKHNPLVIQLKPLHSETSTEKDKYSKSTSTLIKVFGEEEFVMNYDKARKSAKNNQYFIPHYEKALAVVEVRLKSKEQEARKELKKNEIKMIETNTSVIPNLKIREHYDKLVNILTYIKSIKRQLSL